VKEDITPIVQQKQKVFISSHADLILKGKVKMKNIKTELWSHMFAWSSPVNFIALCELTASKTANSRN
jgi:hypothetical protein